MPAKAAAAGTTGRPPASAARPAKTAPKARSQADAGDGQPIAAVERALSVLSAFRAAPRMTLSDLSKQTGLFKSTLLRILGTLERQGYVTRLADGRYRVGGVLFELGAGYVASFQLEEIVRPVLVELAGASGESAAFYVRAGEQRQCLFRVDSTQAVRHVIVAGQILDLDTAATSQILRHYARAGTRPVRGEDYAELCRATSGRGDSQTASVAAPIFDTAGFLGVMNISGPVHRFTPATVARFRADLAAAAQRTSEALGGIAEGPPAPG